MHWTQISFIVLANVVLGDMLHLVKYVRENGHTDQEELLVLIIGNYMIQKNIREYIHSLGMGKYGILLYIKIIRVLRKRKSYLMLFT